METAERSSTLAPTRIEDKDGPVEHAAGRRPPQPGPGGARSFRLSCSRDRTWPLCSRGVQLGLRVTSTAGGCTGSFTQTDMGTERPRERTSQRQTGPHACWAGRRAALMGKSRESHGKATEMLGDEREMRRKDSAVGPGRLAQTCSAPAPRPAAGRLGTWRSRTASTRELRLLLSGKTGEVGVSFSRLFYFFKYL